MPIPTESVETLAPSTPNTEVLFATLLDYQPKPVATFVPENAVEQKKAFLDGDIRTPDNTYSKLEAFDANAAAEAVSGLMVQIEDSLGENSVDAPVYEQFGERYLKTAQFMDTARRFNQETDETRRQNLAETYMRLNIELYGEPDETTYRSLLSDKINELRVKSMDGRAQEVYGELLDRLPRSIVELEGERFRPSQETVAWAGRIVEALYGNFLTHVPEDQASFNDQEIKQIFQEIIQEEFQDVESGINAAEGWVVEVKAAQSINVKNTEKRIVIPEGRTLSRDLLRKRIVHELGTHMFRSVMGEQTTLYPLTNGLVEYYDAEEGLGVVMEQALGGAYKEAGVGHYLSAGLAYFDQKDFRDTFEIKWRIAALEKLKPGEELTEEAITKARSLSYANTMRTFRGTDSLPWFKDLAYYNGVDSVWRYLEDHQGDDTYVSLLLLGKADPSSNLHRRILLETSSKPE